MEVVLQPDACNRVVMPGEPSVQMVDMPQMLFNLCFGVHIRDIRHIRQQRFEACLAFRSTEEPPPGRGCPQVWWLLDERESSSKEVCIGRVCGAGMTKV
mmetsp:Transcript_93363/g.302205  ORF Transcript_93363/g.302205 Transcript_93363/m.302205 type:complete len:99 (+) Transcript_93363:399-695(+)